MTVIWIVLLIVAMLIAAVLLTEIILDVQERRADREVEEPDPEANARPAGNVVVLHRERSE